MHGVACGTIEGVFVDWIPENITDPQALFQTLSGCDPVAKRLSDGTIDMFEEIVRIVCDCFTRDRLPNDESAWDQEGVRNFLKAAWEMESQMPISTLTCGHGLRQKSMAAALLLATMGLLGRWRLDAWTQGGQGRYVSKVHVLMRNNSSTWVAK